MSITADTDFLMRWRMLKDHAARHAVGIGGISVIVAIILIFVYLLYVVIPMFEGAEIQEVATYTLPGQDEALYYAMEEQAEVGMQVDKNGKVLFFKTETGSSIKEVELPIPAGVIVTSLAEADPASGILAVGLSNGQALVFRHAYRITYPNDQRLITPLIEFPFGETPLVVDEEGLPLLQLAVQTDDEQLTFAAVVSNQRILLNHQVKEESLLEDTVTWQTSRSSVAQRHQSRSPIASVLLAICFTPPPPARSTTFKTSLCSAPAEIHAIFVPEGERLISSTDERTP